MRVLVVGNGGREHALCLALSRSERVRSIAATQPNAGMLEVAEAVAIAPTDVDGIAEISSRYDLLVVGPEAPLVAGVADRVRALGVPVLGPSAAAAQIEGSKHFAKALMDEAGIATAAYAVFTAADDAIAWMRAQGRPMVVKADGLAAGKGVVVPESMAEAETAIRDMLGAGTFGEAGARVVLEERMTGPEVSVIGLVDGETVRAFPAARDHKRALDGDRGPNTGGMGAFSPVPDVSDALHDSVVETVLGPTARAMVRRGTPFNGFLYAGLMLTPDGPRVLEFNARMGDPECQPLMTRLRSDAGEVFLAAAQGRLDSVSLRFDARPTVCVVLTSGGYPGAYAKGKEITGLAEASSLSDVTVVHAGTRLEAGRVVTHGGRVLSVVAQGDSFESATKRAYQAADRIHFEGKALRRDIAASAVA